MFRRNKGPRDGGFGRISRMIEDRQRELDDDDGALTEIDDDTIDLSGADRHEDDEEGAVSLLSLRGQSTSRQAPDDEPDFERVLERPSAPVTGYAAPAAAFAPEETTPSTVPASSEARPMSVPDLRAGQAGASLVAPDASWEGNLHAEGDIRVEGVLRGEIETAATLIVAPNARVHGTIRARNVLIGGDVEGDVTCEERLEILPGGSARGQINSGTLVVHEGAYIDSRFQMRRESAVSGT